ncbi:hypothetical protein PLEOSDRAFT_33228 [Pleurotus ostreatus PC15]|uniref:non-specific serine/threonine protein kinase n=1 Tax=Pleurotus ostreatus (strain PC15) TaxID=1137138 RepID=A0A067NCG2_PLEO1|nr:hypothetical protein PLEOSDRAFT_33228 [Pleurotus ostreatus PC15]
MSESNPPSSHNSDASSGGSLSGFPEEDLRTDGRNNPGYFPARLGQPLQQGRYCIVRKLGWGQYSSVWLAKDRGEDRFVALKILTCEATKALSSDENQRSDEQRMLEKIATAEPSHRGFSHSLAYFGSFDFNGPHGLHRCIVTEVLGYSIDYLRKLNDTDRRVAPSIVKRVVKQVLLGLEYLHNVCGIVHTDLKHDNILFRPLDLAGQDLVAVIADVGHSHWKNRHFQELVQPDALRAPEVILGHLWGPPADIWNLGCLVTELLIGFWLFEPNKTDLWGYEEDHLARMTEALDLHFETTMLANSAHRDKYFKADGKLAIVPNISIISFNIHDRILLQSFSELGDDTPRAEEFLRRCLQLAPDKRATATELINDPWLAIA